MTTEAKELLARLRVAWTEAAASESPQDPDHAFFLLAAGLASELLDADGNKPTAWWALCEGWPAYPDLSAREFRILFAELPAVG